MRRTVAVVAALALLIAGQALPANAAPPPAPTDVQVTWAGQILKITWHDAGETNLIRVEYPDLNRTDVQTIVFGNEPNGILFYPDFLEQDRVRLTVTSRVGTVESAATPTAYFDTWRPGFPFVQDADLLPDLSVRLRWSQTPPHPDTTPDDPMDHPDYPEYIRARIAGPVPADPSQQERIPLTVGSLTGVLPPRPRPSNISLEAGNAWGAWYLGHEPAHRQVSVGTMAGKFAVPAQTTFGDYVKINSSLDEYFCTCAEQRDSSIPVWLQARPTATAPWTTVGRYTGGTTSSFPTWITSVGGRQFRLWVPARKRLDQNAVTLTPASSTAAQSTRTMARFNAAGFNVTTAQVGQIVKLTVNVAPAGTVKGALQRWDGKSWRSVLTVPITKGKATMSVRAAGRGTTTTYRVAVPGMMYYGLPVETTGSRAFTLTVR
ncbi:hypothetical protein AB0E69_16160 [Kribbella sp. NPDC026611]|uniref:hypothetical protein n=1 Tax=Kribbella sp. NPDC026611 TaxID=3154911 RepID=UPI0033FBEB9D